VHVGTGGDARACQHGLEPVASGFDEPLSVLLREDTGVDGARTLVATLRVGETPLVDGQVRARFVAELLARVRALPGVEQAGVGSTLPPITAPHSIGLYFADRQEGGSVKLGTASEGYLEALGARLLRGRLFSAADGDLHTPGVVLSASAARFMFPDQDPIGRTLTFRLPPLVGVTAPPRVVGLVRDIKYEGLDADATRAIYVPWPIRPVGDAYLLVQTTGPPIGLASVVRGLVQELDPGVPPPNVQTLGDVTASSIRSRRLRLIPAFGSAGLAWAVALVGLVGSLTRAVAERRHEVAVRLAIGASSRHIVGTVLTRGLVIAGLGVVAGLGLAMAAGHGLASQLYGVSPTDVTTFTTVGTVILATAVAACLLPARRAATVDPMTELRSD